MDGRYFLKVKIKSLAEEARIIRKEERNQKNHSIRSEMQSHRIIIVREESRNALLAYGFIRGREYKQMEKNAKTQPNWRRIKKLIQKYGVVKYYTDKLRYHTDLEKAREEQRERIERAIVEAEKLFGETPV